MDFSVHLFAAFLVAEVIAVVKRPDLHPFLFWGRSARRALRNAAFLVAVFGIAGMQRPTK